MRKKTENIFFSQTVYSVTILETANFESCFDVEAIAMLIRSVKNLSTLRRGSVEDSETIRSREIHILSSVNTKKIVTLSKILIMPLMASTNLKPINSVFIYRRFRTVRSCVGMYQIVFIIKNNHFLVDNEN